MLGLVVIILISWGLLRLIEKKNIDVLGIIPCPNRLMQLLIGVAFMILLSLLMIAIESYVLSVEWHQNESINFYTIVKSFVYHLRSALTEDLIFRGALLYILIQRIGSQKSLLVSALCFGVYHVFSYGMTEEQIIHSIYKVSTDKRLPRKRRAMISLLN